MSRDKGKIFYETHEEILREAGKAKDSEIRDLNKIIERMRVEIEALEITIAEMPQGPIELTERILDQKGANL